MVNDYEVGLTPNPDVLCNQQIKFDAFFQYARDKFQCDFVATGHYARSSPREGYPALLAGIDSNKDQTYFLAGLPHSILQHTLFPLGHLTKPEVYRLAEDFQLPSQVLARKESMGVCFVGKRSFPQFLSQYLTEQPGQVIAATSHDVLGMHSGAFKYTIGQNPRLGSMPTKQYIVGKDMRAGTLYTSSDPNDTRLFANRVLLADMRWSRPNIDLEHPTFARIRHRSALVEARFKANDACAATDGLVDTAITGYHPELSSSARFQQALKHIPASYVAEFKHPVKAAVAGQYAVLYQGEECVGRGRIVAVDYKT